MKAVGIATSATVTLSTSYNEDEHEHQPVAESFSSSAAITEMPK